MGCSELGAIVWARFGLEALEIGDEAIVEAESFTLEGAAPCAECAKPSHTKRAGYTLHIRKAEDLPATERGFSMPSAGWATQGRSW